MRIPTFEVRSRRSIQLARCEQVPPLMTIAGPNGVGKSTLLNELRTMYGNNDVLYVGPHRSARRQVVQQRYLMNSKISLEELLMRSDVPSFEGIQSFGGLRDPWSSDDSASYLKYSLCQIEVERQQAIALRYDREGEILRGSLADPWEPLRELTHNLLPHLSFEKIDTTDRNQVKCLWQVHGKETSVDFDDLSSGEKSIVQMFYPLVENEIRAQLNEIQIGTEQGSRPEICVLIDEPELHLHPNLQLKVFDYLRLLTTDGRIQVILATHSPTMAEYASFEELFLLRPIELVGADDNQLVQVANDEERLRFLRDVFGTTSNLTAMQPIVIVEGTSERDTTKAVADRKLYRALHPRFDHVTLISGGGKSECRALQGALNGALKTFSPQLHAIALLDRDHEGASADENIYLLPVSMIENFLLDPDTIWEAIQSVVERTSLGTVDDVASALEDLLTEAEPEEIDRRALATLGPGHFWPKLPAEHVSVQVAAFVAELQSQYSDENIRVVLGEARRKVDELRNQHRRREEFHGKSILNSFYKAHLHSAGLPKVVFSYETARHARRRRAVVTYFDEFFAKFLGEFNR